VLWSSENKTERESKETSSNRLTNECLWSLWAAEPIKQRTDQAAWGLLWGGGAEGRYRSACAAPTPTPSAASELWWRGGVLGGGGRIPTLSCLFIN